MQSWGRFLEAGPLLGQEQWCGDDPDVDVAGTKDAIGAGAANTELLAAACVSDAARTVIDYDGGGKTDWFLPAAACSTGRGGDGVALCGQPTSAV
jgi:hypothetical protein